MAQAYSVAVRVAVTVEITVRGQNWNEHTSAEQLHREGGELAVKRITELCQRYVRLTGVPKVEAITTKVER